MPGHYERGPSPLQPYPQRPARWPAVVIRGGTVLFLLALSALIIVLCTR